MIRRPAIMTLVLLFATYFTGVLTPLEYYFTDLRSRLLQRTVESDLVIVEIDSRSLQSLPVWPWPRRYYAQLLDKLQDAGARRVFFDIDLSAHSNPEDDSLLEHALVTAGPVEVVMPVFQQYSNSGNNDEILISQPIDRFREHVTLASVNVRPDADGLIRHISLHDQNQEGGVPSAAAVLNDWMGSDRELLQVDYSISPDSFPRLSFVDILNGDFSPDIFNDKQVIVGSTAIELGDILPAPVHKTLPGPVVQAIAYQSLQQGMPIQVPGWLTITLLVLLTPLILKWFIRWGWRKSLVNTILVSALVYCASVYVYSKYHLSLDFTPFLMLSILAMAMALFSLLDQQSLNLLRQRMNLLRTSRLMTNIVENSIDGIITIDEEGAIKSANSAIKRIFKHPSNHPASKSISELFPALGQDGWLHALGMHRSHTENNFELIGRCHDGVEIVIELALSELRLDERRLYTAILRDITEQKAQQIQLRHQATHDDLTGLANRNLLQLTLKEAVNTDANASENGALLMLDLNRFKEINDTLGHAVGDQILCEVGRRFVSTMTDNVMIARVGGDEFTALIRSYHSLDEVVAIATALSNCVRQPFEIKDVALEVGVSIGIALFPEHARDPVTLMQRADVAMYLSKRAQSNFEIYDQSLDTHSVRRLAMTANLRTAIETDQLEMYYQPKVDLENDKVVSVEALVRWHHPKLGMIPPDEFIEIAECTDLIRPLTDWTLEAVLKQCREWRSDGHALNIAINLSARYLQDIRLPEALSARLQHHKVEKEWLELEITESALMTDPERAMEVINKIHALGLQIAIDDFGTGYSSLSYLKRLPVNILKIDKSFIMDICGNDKDQSIVESAIGLAHALGLKVVAEGVESSDVSEMLKAMGCDYGQGYWYSRPVPASELIEWIDVRQSTAEYSPVDARSRIASGI